MSHLLNIRKVTLRVAFCFLWLGSTVKFHSYVFQGSAGTKCGNVSPGRTFFSLKYKSSQAYIRQEKKWKHLLRLLSSFQPLCWLSMGRAQYFRDVSSLLFRFSLQNLKFIFYRQWRSHPSGPQFWAIQNGIPVACHFGMPKTSVMRQMAPSWNKNKGGVPKLCWLATHWSSGCQLFLQLLPYLGDAAKNFRCMNRDNLSAVVISSVRMMLHHSK